MKNLASLEVIAGNATDEELAALVAILATHQASPQKTKQSQNRSGRRASNGLANHAAGGWRYSYRPR